MEDIVTLPNLAKTKTKKARQTKTDKARHVNSDRDRYRVRSVSQSVRFLHHPHHHPLASRGLSGPVHTEYISISVSGSVLITIRLPGTLQHRYLFTYGVHSRYIQCSTQGDCRVSAVFRQTDRHISRIHTHISGLWYYVCQNVNWLLRSTRTTKWTI